MPFVTEASGVDDDDVSAWGSGALMQGWEACLEDGNRPKSFNEISSRCGTNGCCLNARASPGAVIDGKAVVGSILNTAPDRSSGGSNAQRKRRGQSRR